MPQRSRPVKPSKPRRGWCAVLEDQARKGAGRRGGDELLGYNIARDALRVLGGALKDPHGIAKLAQQQADPPPRPTSAVQQQRAVTDSKSSALALTRTCLSSALTTATVSPLEAVSSAYAPPSRLADLDIPHSRRQPKLHHPDAAQQWCSHAAGASAYEWRGHPPLPQLVSSVDVLVASFPR